MILVEFLVESCLPMPDGKQSSNLIILSVVEV